MNPPYDLTDMEDKTGRKLISLVPTLMKHISERELEPAICARDLSGYFSTVFTVHPFAPEDKVLKLDSRNLVYEFTVKPLGLPSWLNWLNYFIAQVRLIKLLYALIKRERVCAIKAHDPYLIGLDGVILSVLTGRPLVVFILSNYDLTHKATGQLGFSPFRLRCIEKILERIVFRSAKMVWAGNENNKEFAISNGARPEKCHTVRTIGICDYHFEPLRTRSNLKRSMGLQNQKVLLYVGRLSAEKYPEDVIRCAASLSSWRDDFKLLIAGDGVMASDLKLLARHLGIFNRIVFMGFQTQQRVKDLLFSADVILSPLSGSALVEAALSGTCIVAYDIEWHTEIIRHGFSGLLVKYRDYEGLARATLTLLDGPVLAERLGKNARDLAFRMFGTDQVQEEERRCFEKLFH